MYVDFFHTRQSEEAGPPSMMGNFSPSSPHRPNTPTPVLCISYGPGESYLQDQSRLIIPCSSVACARKKWGAGTGRDCTLICIEEGGQTT